jgi:hypothetical protein
MNARLLLACAPLLLAACAAHNIPGTQIPDTQDTHAILDVMERYRSAIEARDAKAIQQLVSKSFRDSAGTDDPQDDLTYANLPQALPALFARLDTPRVDLDVRSVSLRDGSATVIYYWNASWRMPGLLERPQRDAELEQMVLLKEEDGQWRIVSGI